jgi:hypothetical protein
VEDTDGNSHHALNQATLHSRVLVVQLFAPLRCCLRCPGGHTTGCGGQNSARSGDVAWTQHNQWRDAGPRRTALRVQQGTCPCSCLAYMYAS